MNLFDRLIFKEVIGLVWVLGAIVCTFGPLVYFNPWNERTPEGAALWAIAAIIIGNLLWRLVCEVFILGFVIHDTLKDVRGLLQEQLQELRKPAQAGHVRGPQVDATEPS